MINDPAVCAVALSLVCLSVRQSVRLLQVGTLPKQLNTRMWANAQRDGRPAEYMWRPLFNAAKFG